MQPSSVKLSKYTAWLTIGDSRYLFAVKSGAFSKVDAETEQKLLNVKKLDDFEDEKERDFLISRGFLVPSELDEFWVEYHNSLSAQFDPHPDHIHFVIAVSEQCNYRCVYCYEESTMTRTEMSAETAAEVVMFIEKTIQTQKPNLKKLTISWFGGEPVIALKTIDLMSKQIVKICEENNVEYSAGIVSNGSLINSHAVEVLVNAKVTHAQISIDGERSVSCQYKGSSPSQYDKSIDAIMLLAKQVGPVNVRLNCDGKNFDSILKAVAEIHTRTQDEKVAEKVFFYLAPIDMNCQEMFPSWFVDATDKFLDFLEEIGKTGDIEGTLPKAKSTSCGLICDSGFTINANGTIAKCEHYVGDSTKVIGDVKTGLWHNHEEARLHDISVPLKCQDCNLYPICHQWCLHKRLDDRAEMNCDGFRRYVYNVLKHIVHYKK